MAAVFGRAGKLVSRRAAEARSAGGAWMPVRDGVPGEATFRGVRSSFQNFRNRLKIRGKSDGLAIHNRFPRIPRCVRGASNPREALLHRKKLCVSASLRETFSRGARSARWMVGLALVALLPGPGRAQEPFTFATASYESGDWDSAPLVPANLIHSIAQYTEIEVAPEGAVVALSSREIFRYPFLFLTGHLPVRFTEAESRNLREYVERGGFVFIDDHNHDIDAAFHRTTVAELARIFGENALVELPNDHELYRAFFVFEDGPPTTSHELNGWGDGLIHENLYAILVNGRIGVLYSNKDYSSEWSYHVQNKRFQAIDNTRFGVNIIVYALTR